MCLCMQIRHSLHEHLKFAIFYCKTKVSRPRLWWTGINENIVYSESVLNLSVMRVLCVFVRAFLSGCPSTWHVYIVYNILSLNISSIYIINTICVYDLSNRHISAAIKNVLPYIFANIIILCLILIFFVPSSKYSELDSFGSSTVPGQL